MKVVYRILEKESRNGGNNYRLRGEVFFTSRKKAVDYMHRKYEGLPQGTCYKYEEGKYLRYVIAPAACNPYHALYPIRRYELDVVPVN